jgi:predicted acetyltransferase
MTLKFITPNRDIFSDYISALREGMELHALPEECIQSYENNFDVWWDETCNIKVPVRMPNGELRQKVPETILWLVRDKDFIGRVGIRHTLNENLKQFGGHIGYAVRPKERQKGYGKMLLAEGLRFAQSIGIKEALLTCNSNNITSIKIIESFKGQLQDSLPIEGKDYVQYRYWIKL